MTVCARLENPDQWDNSYGALSARILCGSRNAQGQQLCRRDFGEAQRGGDMAGGAVSLYAWFHQDGEIWRRTKKAEDDMRHGRDPAPRRWNKKWSGRRPASIAYNWMTLPLRVECPRCRSEQEITAVMLEVFNNAVLKYG